MLKLKKPVLACLPASASAMVALQTSQWKIRAAARSRLRELAPGAGGLRVQSLISKTDRAATISVVQMICGHTRAESKVSFPIFVIADFTPSRAGYHRHPRSKRRHPAAPHRSTRLGAVQLRQTRKTRRVGGAAGEGLETFGGTRRNHWNNRPMETFGG